MDKYFKVSVADVKDFNPKTESGVIFANPPYGERLLDINAANKIYKTMGKVFTKDKFSSYIVSASEDFPEYFGRRESKNRKLFNGSIKCRVYMYY